MVKISVIIPTFKRINQTLKTLTLLQQSTGVGKDFTAEFIVSDSTPDKSLENEIQKFFSQKVVYTKPDRPGIAANKNQGAKIASNPLLIFCDSDIEVEKETILKSIDGLKLQTAAAVSGQVVWRGGVKDGQFDRPRSEDRQITIQDTTYTEAIYSRYLVTFKEVFWSVGGYDETLFNMRGEGSDLSLRYWRAGFPLVFNQDIKVHHVYTAEDAAAVRIKHAEWGIAKDLLLLAYKYDMLDGDYPNFSKTIAANFSPLGEASYWRMIQGIGKNINLIGQVEKLVTKEQPLFDFKFLEIFSNMNMLNACIDQAVDRLKAIRSKAFA